MKRKNVIRILRLFVEACNSLVELRKTRQHSALVFVKDYLTEDEAAIYLDRPKSYVKKLMRGDGNGPIIPYYQPTANNCYIARVDLERFITRIRHRSADEIKAAAQRK